MTNINSIYASDRRPGDDSPARYTDRMARWLVLRQLRQLRRDRLVLVDGRERYEFGDNAGDNGLIAQIDVSDPRFYGAVAAGGSVGAAEAYMRDYWDTDDLTRVVRVLARNQDMLDGMEKSAVLRALPLPRLMRWINRNTVSGSRRNIAAHYDLGNEFFRLWLDDTMMYSSAVFERPEMNLTEASIAKLDRICRKLELSPSDHVLEIGTGWGGFAIYAAKNYGCRVTSTTISREQYEYAAARVAEAGLGDRITLLCSDYRKLEGCYDKLVSIEMIEAVGSEYLDVYFAACSNLLKPDGMMMLQAITIQDQRYKSALKNIDFIKRYIFPGGFLPSVTAMLQSITKCTDMRIFHLEDIGEHYAKTLNAWKKAFHEASGQIRAMQFSEEFLRMWHFYYCYCEGAFLERVIGNAQILLVKPRCRRSPIVPAMSSSG